jgi:hypothetical protein
MMADFFPAEWLEKTIVDFAKSARVLVHVQRTSDVATSVPSQACGVFVLIY